jgi:hypothetical protein
MAFFFGVLAIKTSVYHNFSCEGVSRLRRVIWYKILTSCGRRPVRTFKNSEVSQSFDFLDAIEGARDSEVSQNLGS